MRGSLGLGLVIGLSAGAGGMYLALRQPWAGHGTSPADAGVVAAAPADAGVVKPKKKHVRRHTPGAPTASGDESGWGGSDTVEETEVQLVALTAADRTLEWRGDDTSRPPQRIDMTTGNEARSLDDGEIQATIASQSGAVQSCVVAAATNTDLHGVITVKMVVDGGGRVTKSKLQAPHYMLEHGLLACVQRALGHVHFPATGASTLVTLPVNLT